MKKCAFLVVLALLVAPGAAFSQSAPGTSPNGMSQNRPNGRQGANTAQFQKHKAEILQRLSERMTKLEQRQSCVQAANDRQALKACLPQQGKGQQ